MINMRIVTDVIVFAVLAFFAYVIVSLLIRDARNKKIKEGIAADGVNTMGVITDVSSRSGGNSGFINITVSFDYEIEPGEKISGKADAVIDVMKINKYQPGETISLRYSRKEPEKVVVDIPNPLLKRR